MSTEIPIENKMRLKHGAMVHWRLTSGERVLEDEWLDPDQLNGHIAVVSITYNRLSVSGGTSWWDPKTGYSIKRPKYTMKVKPEDVLTGDQLCDCPQCLEEDA